MNGKLTLTIDKELIELGKKYAKNSEINISKLVANYFQSLGENTDSESITISPTVQGLLGSFAKEKPKEKAVKLPRKPTNKTKKQ